MVLRIMNEFAALKRTDAWTDLAYIYVEREWGWGWGWGWVGERGGDDVDDGDDDDDR